MTTRVIYLLLILQLCLGFEEDNTNSKARNFSLELGNYTGLEHFAFAPFNIWSLVVAAGLWTHGETREKISSTLKLPTNKTIFLNQYTNLKRTIFDEKSNGVNVSIGNFIYMSSDCKIFPEFRNMMTAYFDTVIKTLNFDDTEKAAQMSDDLIAQNGLGYFDIFRPADFIGTEMIMTSVITFNSFWKSQFNPMDTTIERQKFENDGNIYLFTMMHKRLTVPFTKMESLNANVMELALGQDGKFSTLLIFPYQHTNVRDVYKKLSGVTLKHILDKLQTDVAQFGLREVNLTLPKGKIETYIFLNGPLSDIGLGTLFESNGVNFMGITSDNLHISSIDHTCEVVFMETGIYAMASTPGYRDFNVFPEIPVQKPFIFFITEKSTQSIIFGGLFSKIPYILGP